MRPVTRRRLRLIGGLAAYFVALWLLWGTFVVYPLKVFVVLLHEVSHGLAAMATGGAVHRIVLGLDESGATYVLGGNRFLTLSAGYLGSLIWGLILLFAARAGSARVVRWTVAGLGGFLAFVVLAYVRNAFGLLFGVAVGGLLLLASARLRTGLQRVLLTALGLTSALYALLDIRSDILQRPELQSDARMLAELTGVPTVVWGLLWIGIALLLCSIILRRFYRQT